MTAVIDFKTTGFKAGIDEILQASIIDENYNILFNAYCKPLRSRTWEEAQKINGITPNMVEGKPPFESCRDKVKKILTAADEVVAYNADFENGFLKAYGICIDPGKWIDPMIMFARIYGEYDGIRDSYKWQSLIKCAEYYGYKFKAHDSLEVVKATLYCYKKIIADMQKLELIARCPHEVGDKVNITFHDGAGVIGGPVTARTAEVIITDILAVHSFKRQQVTFMYEINNAKVLQLVEWEAANHGKR